MNTVFFFFLQLYIRVHNDNYLHSNYSLTAASGAPQSKAPRAEAIHTHMLAAAYVDKQFADTKAAYRSVESKEAA